MTGSVVPDLIDALVAQATTALPTVLVSDGFPVTDDPGDFLMVGWDGPDNVDVAVAASASQEPGPFGTNRPRDESGTVSFVAHSWNGDGDQKAARDAVYVIARAVEGLCRSNPTLGVTGVLWTGYGPTADLSQAQDGNGARAYLSFSISFRARI